MRLSVRNLEEKNIQPERRVVVNMSHAEEFNGNKDVVFKNSEGDSIMRDVSLSDDVPSNIILMGRDVRESLNVMEGDEVEAKNYQGDKVIVQVDSEVKEIDENKKKEIAVKTLQGRGVSPGDSFSATEWTGDIELVVQQVEVGNTVYVDEDTEIVVRGADNSSTSVNGFDEESAVNSRDVSSPPTYSDIGGMEDEIQKMREMVELPLKFPQIYERNGVSKPTGVLLYGPPGTGKTYLTMAVANETDVNFEYISGPDVLSKYRGESSSNLREVFEEASEEAPSILFIDEIDSIASSRENTQAESQTSIVAQLLSLMDGLDAKEDVIVVGATNRVDTLDDAVRRTGRFDREIEIGVPDKEERKQIIDVQMRSLSLDDSVDTDYIADHTHGYVASDLESVAMEAGINSIHRREDMVDIDRGEVLNDEVYDIDVDKQDIDIALKSTSPSAMRGSASEVPEVTFDDVGGLSEAKNELRKMVIWPMDKPELYEEASTEPPKGMLLHGPPGTGKTLLARAVSNEADANFIHVDGPEIFDKFVGESEKKIRQLFERARQNSPCILFFDEIDAIASNRGGQNFSNAGDNVVSQLLTEIDGVEELEDVFILAATNIPDQIDPAVLRSGRIEKDLEIGKPKKKERREILKIHTEGKPLGDDVSIEDVADMATNFNGSQLESLCRTASLEAIEETAQGDMEEVVINRRHFEKAMGEINSSKRLTESKQKALAED